MGFQTDAIHAGQTAEPVTGAIMTPIFQTSTYVQEEIGKHKGFEYSRTQNPTRHAMEENIAVLESGKYGIAFSSGLAAISSIIEMLEQGDHVICTDNVYGGTFRVFDTVFKKFGLDFSFVDTSNFALIEQACTEKTKLIFVETPTNPMLTLTSLKKLADYGKKQNILTVVDNTFMSPYFQKPLEFGIDLVVHSTTKYLNGHSDVVGGIVLTANKELSDKLHYIQNAVGAVPGPMDCFLVLRATKTLALRMREHEKNSIALANFLNDHPKVEKVIYPGLESHPQHELAKEQMSGFGGIISIELGSLENSRKFAESLKIFALAESLGGVESLVDHPAIMTHASVPQNERVKLGITDGLIRLSVGVEDEEDLIEDVRQALGNI
ncbi:MAG: PLP-dependent transferase [Calditrichaeota bacterium]|nr:MAG: PLP-dependent transferase [Calditrichota bacterium]MBL1206776.1 PLP-dependent transferase [Calditrichota bacterium]NOG46602.1 PLP-dependent transferase [Calditrichota bacterium]